ncbi:hypothetical protein [Gimesia maris]|uniref:hypothetical protein n=1 Tax=Gimesia maris TaxID=122 RepID=UPI0030DD175A|tara:strand:- start:487 stop:1920 length:1434 start_codon:yes stop_codon:yes gene_type:complete
MNKNILTNFKDVKIVNKDGTTKKGTAPKSMQEMVKEIQSLLKGWPKVCGNELFYHDPKSGTKVDFISNAAALGGIIGTLTGQPSKFYPYPGYHKLAEFLKELIRVSERFDDIADLPHEPKMPGTYYTCDFPEPGNGDALQGLVDRFSPETQIDSHLILAAIVTLFWGGRGGQRPAFLITSDDGPGSGKSQFVNCLSKLVNGKLDVSPKEDSSQIKQRMLSAEATGKRIFAIDNLKSYKYSNSELEAMITLSEISGKRLYVGEATRPNTFCYFITVNGASLSKDLAQRCVIIKLSKPRYSLGWEDETHDYIEKNQAAIIADVIGFLRKDVEQSEHISSRWGPWYRDVLSRLPDPIEAHRLIRERQQITDVDQEETGIIEDYFRGKLADCRYSVDTEKVFIPNTVATDWYNKATGEKNGTSKVSRILKQKISEECFSCLQVNSSGSYGRGFLWVGQQWDCISTVRTDLLHQIEINGKLA